MNVTTQPSPDAAILARLTGPDTILSVATAKGFLALEFSPDDKKRMDVLAAKARAGELTTQESAEIDAYSRISSLLGVLKSRARRALKRRAGKGSTSAN